MSTQLLSGSVKRVFFGKGYGFITGDDGNEYFFHVFELSHGSAALERMRPGDRVNFYAEAKTYTDKSGETHDGWKALRVKPTGEAA